MNLVDVKNFGGTDADEDSLLLHSFEDHPAYIDLLAHEKFCIVGRKGSGKTAIFKKMITLKAHDKFSFGHTFKDYPWHHHEKQRKTGVPDEQCYVHAWMYLCLMSLAKILLNADNSQPYNDESVESLRKLESFIVDTYGSRDPDVTQIFSPAYRLKFTSDIGVDWKIFRASSKIESVEMTDLPTVIQEVNLNLKEAVINSLNPEISYYVLFDELDLGFNKEKSDYSLRLVGLLLAAKELNSFSRAQAKKMTIGTFLRDDIYDFIKFEDKNKITENNVSYVFWDHGQRNKTLKGLMEKRFNYVLGDNNPVSWADLFDESHEMTGRQKKYNYILDRTFLRPRDMIKMCNEILLEYKDDNNRGDKFANSHVLAAQPAYSDYLYRELQDEIFKHIPKFSEYIDILKNMESLQFSKDELMSALKRYESNLESTDTFENIMRNLFDFSIIGYYTAGGAGGGSDYVWKYKDNRAKLDNSATQFKVHPGFKDVFGLKKFSRSE
jgi:hypothetical protein